MITPVFTLDWFALFDKKVWPDGKEEYLANMLFDPSTFSEKDKVRWKEMHDKVEAVIADRLKHVPRQRVITPFRDDSRNEIDKYPYLAGKILVIAKTQADKNKPRIVDSRLVDVEEKHRVYRGCQARCDVGFGAYDHGKNKGVSVYLNNFMLVGDGTPLGNAAAPAEVAFGSLSPEEMAVNRSAPL